MVFLAGIAGLAIAAGAYRLHSRQAAAAASLLLGASAQPSQGNLRQVMESRLHPEYTNLSFTIWHDQPLTAGKMDSMAASSGRIVAVAQGLGAYESVYRQLGWSEQDVRFFEQKRMQLARVAEELKEAAQQHDPRRVTSSFNRLGNTCQSCHRRFRKDLSWK